jgi:hypothetical protein
VTYKTTTTDEKSGDTEFKPYLLVSLIRRLIRGADSISSGLIALRPVRVSIDELRLNDALAPAHLVQLYLVDGALTLSSLRAARVQAYQVVVSEGPA